MLLHVNQYMVCTIYKPGPDLCIKDWLSRQNHHKNKDEEITGMTLNSNVIDISADISACITVKEMQDVMQNDKHLQNLAFNQGDS